MSNLRIIKNSTKVQDCHDSGKDAEWETYVLNILNMYECFQPDGAILAEEIIPMSVSLY